MAESFDTQQINTLIPQKFKIFSGSTLKVIAVIAMLIDHTASVLLRNSGINVLEIGSHILTLYELMRYIGRIAFPIFAFEIGEGYIHTHDRKKYGISLLVFALISEIPWNLEHSGGLLYSGQNVFFTLFLGYLGICVYEKYKADIKRMSLCLIGLLLVSFLFRSDYGCAGFGLIVLLYILREKKIFQAIAGISILKNYIFVAFAFLLINLYNGKRGFVKSKVLKYAFYLIYPVHMLVLYFIKKYTIGY